MVIPVDYKQNIHVLFMHRVVLQVLNQRLQLAAAWLCINTCNSRKQPGLLPQHQCQTSQMHLWLKPHINTLLKLVESFSRRGEAAIAAKSWLWMD